MNMLIRAEMSDQVPCFTNQGNAISIFGRFVISHHPRFACAENRDVYLIFGDIRFFLLGHLVSRRRFKTLSHGASMRFFMDSDARSNDICCRVFLGLVGDAQHWARRFGKCFMAIANVWIISLQSGVPLSSFIVQSFAI